MGVPKKKMSRSRSRRRHAQWKSRGATALLSPCPKCDRLRKNHHMCVHCGYYSDKNNNQGGQDGE